MSSKAVSMTFSYFPASPLVFGARVKVTVTIRDSTGTLVDPDQPTDLVMKTHDPAGNETLLAARQESPGVWTANAGPCSQAGRWSARVDVGGSIDSAGESSFRVTRTAFTDP